MESQTFVDEMSTWRRIVLIATWVLVTVVVFAVGTVLLGLLFAALGGVIFVLYRWLGKTQVITCDDSGLFVKATSRRKGTTETKVTWPQITETRYKEETTGDDDEGGETTTGYFTVLAGTSIVLRVTDASKSFKQLIAAIGNGTAHLGYQWVPRKQAEKDQILDRAGNYVKIRR